MWRNTKKKAFKYLELWLHVKVLIQSLCTQHAFKYKNRLLIMFIYTFFFFYKYKYTNVFLKYKDKYGHIVYQTRNTNFFWGGFLAFTKHNNYIRNATLTTIAGLFFSFSFFHLISSPSLGRQRPFLLFSTRGRRQWAADTYKDIFWGGIFLWVWLQLCRTSCKSLLISATSSLASTSSWRLSLRLPWMWPSTESKSSSS